MIPSGRREAALTVLDGEGIDYAVWEETGRGDFEAVVSFPVPPAGVESALERLRNVGIRDDSYAIVLPTETVVSARIDALRGRYRGNRISREELLARTEDLAPETSTYVAFLLLSTLIAAAGLLSDSEATIVGAMVIAPLMGPALSASIGTVLGDRDLASRGVALQTAGLLLVVATAALLGWALRETMIVPPATDLEAIPQVRERLTPNFLSLFLALGSGTAGALSLVRNAGTTLVGVAIAVALVPPAATAGLAVAWGLPLAAAEASVLVLVNLLAINLSALVLLWAAGYRPERSSETAAVRRTLLSRLATIAAVLAVLSVVLAGVTYASFGTPAEVTVVVGHPDGASVPGLADRIDERLTGETGRDTSVEVVYVTSQESA